MWFAYQPTRDGRIVPCRVAESGEQIPIPGASVMADPLSVTLTAHPSGKFLYASTRFDQNRDGWNVGNDPPRPPERAQSFLRVYRIAAAGGLTLIQTSPVKGILAGPMVYPDGRRFFAQLPENRYLVFDIRPDGTLAAPRRFPAFPTFILEWSVGVSDDDRVAFAPGKRIGYYSRRWVMLEVSGSVVQRLRVLADGSVKFEGEEWIRRGEDPPAPSARNDPGHILYRPDGRSAVMQGRSRFLWHFPADSTGRLRTEAAIRYPLIGKLWDTPSPFYRRSKDGAWTLFAIGRNESENFLYRLPAPGKAERTASFGAKDQLGLRPSPDGRILYPYFGDWKAEGRHYDYQIAAYRVDDRGRVTPSVPRRPIDVIAPESIVFLERERPPPRLLSPARNGRIIRYDRSSRSRKSAEANDAFGKSANPPMGCARPFRRRPRH